MTLFDFAKAAAQRTEHDIAMVLCGAHAMTSAECAFCHGRRQEALSHIATHADGRWRKRCRQCRSMTGYLLPDEMG